eukprot:4989411-Ditylum_brightwellii.AAC.1
MDDLAVLRSTSGGCGYFLIFHHTKELGLFLLGQVVKKVALVGFEDSTISVLINEEPLMVIKEHFKVLKFKFLKKMKSEDEVIAKMIAGAKQVEKLRIRNSITIPPWITEAVIKGESELFAEAFVVVLDAARSKYIIDSVDSGDKSDSSDREDGNNVKDNKILLQHLYAWAHNAALWDTNGDVVSNAVNAMFDEITRGWKNDIQSRMISKQIQEDGSSVNNRTMCHLNVILMDLKEEIANGRKSNKKEDSKMGALKLS